MIKDDRSRPSSSPSTTHLFTTSTSGEIVTLQNRLWAWLSAIALAIALAVAPIAAFADEPTPSASPSVAVAANSEPSETETPLPTASASPSESASPTVTPTPTTRPTVKPTTPPVPKPAPAPVLKRTSKSFKIIAHRGLGDNDLSSFLAADKAGADIVESDMHRTRDGVIVLNHDATFRAGGKTYRISSTNFATIRRLTSRNSIPTVREFMYTMRNRGAVAQLEFKYVPSSWAIKYVVKLARTYHVGLQLSSFKSKTTKKIRKASKSTTRVYITATCKSLKTVKKAKANAVDLRYTAASKSCITKYRNAGLKVYIYTVSNSTWYAYWSRGASGIITDNAPVALRTVGLKNDLRLR